MTHVNTVTVSLEDLWEVVDAVSTMMHVLDNGKTKYLELEIDRVHRVVESWAVDGTVLAGGCQPDHRCSLCHDFPDLAEWRVRRSQQANADLSAQRDSEGEATLEMSEPFLSGGEMTYIYQGEEFTLEHVSQSVVQVTNRYETGCFGLGADWDTTHPYTWTRQEGDVHPGDIARNRHSSYSTPRVALDTLCYAILNDVRRRPPRRVLREFTECLLE